jgi:3-methyladenine DNA glycosylase AlkC
MSSKKHRRAFKTIERKQAHFVLHFVAIKTKNSPFTQWRVDLASRQVKHSGQHKITAVIHAGYHRYHF